MSISVEWLFIVGDAKRAIEEYDGSVEDLIGQIRPLCITPNIGLNTLFIHSTSGLSGRD